MDFNGNPFMDFVKNSLMYTLLNLSFDNMTSFIMSDVWASIRLKRTYNSLFILMYSSS